VSARCEISYLKIYNFQSHTDLCAKNSFQEGNKTTTSPSGKLLGEAFLVQSKYINRSKLRAMNWNGLEWI